MDEDIVIKTEDLSKVYHIYDKPSDRLKEVLHPLRKIYHKEFYALNHVSFEVKRGETVGIIGKNGAGKSTLLKILTNVLTPSSGRAEVRGKTAALLELGAGFNYEMTGIENIYMNGTIMGYSKKEMTDRLESILDFADIGDFVHQPVKMYSSGMFARLAFAVAINVEPDILIVDETLSVGDLRFQIKCLNRMQEMMQGGTTVLFVSHDINAMRRFCSKALWLCDGSMRAFGEINSVADMYLEYLKCSDESEPALDEIKRPETDIRSLNNDNGIVEITDFRILNSADEVIDEMELNEYVRIEVTYFVHDTGIENPVLGIAVKSMDDDYVCGLNTLLDKVRIPWRAGENKCSLEYPSGIRAVGGRYYFDVALLEETATVPLQYLTFIKKFKVITGYIGEGRYIIPHQWRVEGREE